jgi:O-antigen/teichoic acid export membrane protein
MCIRDRYNKDSINLISIMIFSIFFGVLNFMYGTLGLNHLGQKRYFAMSIFLTGLISLVLLIVLTKYFSINGTAINFVLSELILLIFILHKYKIRLF